MEVILVYVKNFVGITAGETTFDNELLSLINTAMATAEQLGVPSMGTLVDSETEWPTFAISEQEQLVKTYISQSVKMLFDPTTSATVLQAYDRFVQNLETRLLVAYAEGEEDE